MKKTPCKIISARISKIPLYFLFFFAVISRISPAEIEFSGKNAFELLLKQCSFGPRVPGSPAAAKCADFIEEELARLKLSVKRQTFTVYSTLMQSTVTGVNIIGLYAGDSPTSNLVALSAHWDTRPIADMDPDPAMRLKPILGANDGASGVAALLEIARVMTLRRYPGRIIFLFFDLEDAGLPGSLDQWCLGSKFFAETSLEEYPITLGINLDMIADRDLRIQPEQLTMRYAPHAARDFWTFAQKKAPRYFSDQPLDHAIHDDHEPFLRRGIPYINLIDFSYPPWHTHEDTPDACSAHSLQVVGRVVIGYIFDRWENFEK